ncbi:MAG: CapA family protein [Syntrophomonas sp.]
MTERNTIKFAFIGDLFLGGEFIPYAERHRFDLLKPFEHISNYLSDADILFVNFEGPICSGLNKREDVTAIVSNHPYIIKFFKEFKICVLNLANNHMMDYGSEGLDKTLMLLDSNKLHHIGAGFNDIEADKELIIECKNKNIAFIAYTTDELHVRAVIAQNEKPGCAAYLDLNKVVRKIQDLKNKADVVCVSLHWGHEYYQYPSTEQVTIAHTLADAGADYIIGHHPHVIQGMENYKSTLIIYSLGNFFFSPLRSTAGRLLYQKHLTKEFLIVRSSFSEPEATGYDLLGGIVNRDYCLVPFVGDDLQRFVQKTSFLSYPISDSAYDKFWERYHAKRKKELLRESIFEAFRKLSMISLNDLLRTIGPADIKRNINRLARVLFKSG